MGIFGRLKLMKDDTRREASQSSLSVDIEKVSSGKYEYQEPNEGPVVPVVESLRASNLQRTWSGRECSHTANIFQKPYASIRDSYEVGPVIGEGQFGCVRTCVHKQTGEKFAVKIIIKSSLKTPSAVDLVRTEVSLMEAVREHRTVVGLHDVLEDSKYVCFILELCQGGDLFNRITERKHYPESEAAEVCASIAEVLRHCRSRGVLHRDLKPENILLCNKRSHTRIRVADFGAGTFVKPGKKQTQLAGSCYYVAPEVLKGSYGLEADVWSTGVILYILLCGMPPFWAKEEDDLNAAIVSGKVDMSWGPWPKISSGAKDLVLKMLTLDPAQRITPDAILEDPWLNKYASPAPAPIPVPEVRSRLEAHRRSVSSMPSSPLACSERRRSCSEASSPLASSPLAARERRRSCSQASSPLASSPLAASERRRSCSQASSPLASSPLASSPQESSHQRSCSHASSPLASSPAASSPQESSHRHRSCSRASSPLASSPLASSPLASSPLASSPLAPRGGGDRKFSKPSFMGRLQTSFS
eukprot:jgi/Mesen1/3860/ME000207S02860